MLLLGGGVLLLGGGVAVGGTCNVCVWERDGKRVCR